MKTYGLDLLKGMLVSGVIGGLLLSAVVWFYEWAGSFFWLYAWGIVSVFSVFMAMFYSQLIVPLFNKQTPLEAGALRDKINAFAEKVGFKLDNIFCNRRIEAFYEGKCLFYRFRSPQTDCLV